MIRMCLWMYVFICSGASICGLGWPFFVFAHLNEGVDSVSEVRAPIEQITPSIMWLWVWWSAEGICSLTWTPDSGGKGSGILHIPRVLSVEGMKTSVCEQKNIQADLIRDCECIQKAYNLLSISLNAFHLIITHLVLIIHSSLSGEDSDMASASWILILVFVLKLKIVWKFGLCYPGLWCNSLFLQSFFILSNIDYCVSITLQWIGGGERIPSGWVWAPESEANTRLHSRRVCTSAWRCKAPWLWHAGWSQAAAPAQRSTGSTHADSRGP
jgi:hypothetical protein